MIFLKTKMPFIYYFEMQDFQDNFFSLFYKNLWVLEPLLEIDGFEQTRQTHINITSTAQHCLLYTLLNCNKSIEHILAHLLELFQFFFEKKCMDSFSYITLISLAF